MLYNVNYLFLKFVLRYPNIIIHKMVLSYLIIHFTNGIIGNIFGTNCKRFLGSRTMLRDILYEFVAKGTLFLSTRVILIRSSSVSESVHRERKCAFESIVSRDFNNGATQRTSRQPIVDFKMLWSPFIRNNSNLILSSFVPSGDRY